MKLVDENPIKHLTVVKSTDSFELGGGTTRSWNEIINKLGQNINQNTLYGKAMGELEYVVKQLHRSDCPTKLNPKNATFLDVAVWSYFQRRLSPSTIEKRLRYARFMETHASPVDFRNPNYENFKRHMDYREEIEKASPNALIHEWKAMKMFLEAFGISKWPYKPPYAPATAQRILPFPDVVRHFFSFDYSDDPYENALYQYLFYHNFMIGWRVPSEICEMALDNVIIDSQGRGCIIITETKKHKDKRTILPERHILSSQSHKSLKNWIDKWRLKVANQYSGDALYLWPNGKPVTVRKLGHKLSEHGKKVWPSFRPYDSRHWCAISKLIETKIQNGSFEPYTVKNWLGHTDIKVTESYIHYAEQYYNQCKESWIHSALRSHENDGRGKHEGLTRVCQNNQTLSEFSPRRVSGPGRLCPAH